MTGTPITINGVTAYELHDGSGEGQADQEDGAAQRVFLCAWADMPSLLLNLLGGWSRTGTVLVYTAPAEHPTFATWYCKAAAWVPLGAPSGENTWEYAKITARYGPFPFDPTNPNAAALVEEEVELDGDVVTIPPNTLRDSLQRLINIPTKKLVPCASYRLKFQNFPTVPADSGTGTSESGGQFAAMFNLYGKVNSGTFRGAAAKKMLFEGASLRRSARSLADLDNQGWSGELVFKFRPTEWTKVIGPDGKFAEATTPDGSPLYDSADLTVLLPNSGS